MEILKGIFQHSLMSKKAMWIIGNGIITLMLLLMLGGIALRTEMVPYIEGIAAKIAAGNVATISWALLIGMIVAQAAHLLFSLIEFVSREFVHRHKRVALALLMCIGTSETAFYASHLYGVPSMVHQQTLEGA